MIDIRIRAVAEEVVMKEPQGGFRKTEGVWTRSWYWEV